MQCKIFNETKQYLVQNVVKQNIVRLPLILLLIHVYAITYKDHGAEWGRTFRVFFFPRFQTKRAQRRTFCVAEGD